MSAYREHIAPRETQEEYLARIERERRKRKEPFTTPPTRPAAPINSGPMAPGKPLHGLSSKTPRLDHIDSFGWESFWIAVSNGQFDAKPLSMAPIGVYLA